MPLFVVTSTSRKFSPHILDIQIVLMTLTVPFSMESLYPYHLQTFYQKRHEEPALAALE